MRSFARVTLTVLAFALSALALPATLGGLTLDAVLEDLARTTDTATTRWTARMLEYLDRHTIMMLLAIPPGPLVGAFDAAPPAVARR